LRVFVKNMRREPLMPCSPRKARILLKANQAKIVDYRPFTIQLAIPTGESAQESTVGIDLGSKHIGIAVQSKNKVLAKGEIELRGDVKEKLATRKIYRRSRRNRKTRYRKVRFLNRTSSKKEGWLPPSILSRTCNAFRWIDQFTSLVPNPKLIIEVGKFDVQKMMNPDIQGKEYQQGDTFGYHDVRYYIFARDNYTCQACRKSKDKILQTHHIVYKSQGGTDRASNLITVCTDCHTHENHQEGKIFWKWMKEKKMAPQFKEVPFLNTIRRRIFSKYPEAQVTYGSVTTPRRKELGLEKTHYNDALVISGINEDWQDKSGFFYIKQARKKKRSLHEATARKGRKEANRTQARNKKNTQSSNGFYLNDQVELFGKRGYISGFCNGGTYIQNITGNYITIPEKTYKQVGFKSIKFVCHNNNWQFIPHLLC